MGKTTDELAAAEADASTQRVDYTIPSPSGTTAPGVEPSGYVKTGEGSNALATHGPAGDENAEGSTDEIDQTRHQIEETREHLSHTIDAIQDKLSPAHIAQQAKDTVRDATIGKAQNMVSNAGDTAKGYGSGIVETVRQNPIPAAIAGFGLGWLIMQGRKSTGGENSRYRSYDDRRTYGYGRATGFEGDDRRRFASGDGQGTFGRTHDAVGNVAGRAQNTVSNAAGQAQDAVSNVAGQVQDSAGQVIGQAQNLAGQAGDSLSHLGNQAQYGVQRAQTGFQQLLEENPLAVAAGAVALGLAVGLAVPETAKENELMGPARDNLMHQAQETFQEKAQQVQSVAHEAVTAAKDAAKDAAHDEASNQGLSQ